VQLPHRWVIDRTFSTLGETSRSRVARARSLDGWQPTAIRKAVMSAHGALVALTCGVGCTRLHLAGLSPGVVVALDNHAPFVRRLARTIAEHGLSHRVHPLVGDMSRPAVARSRFDLVHSEGALYFVGVENGLRLWRGLLKPRGYITFTEAVWRKADPPEELRASWTQEYTQMTGVAGNVAIIAGCGYELLGHFSLPEEAWRNASSTCGPSTKGTSRRWQRSI